MRVRGQKLFSSGLAGLVMLLMGLVLAACGENTATVPAQSLATAPALAKNPNQPPVKVAVGSTAPDFTAKDINGQDIKLSALRGKAVLVNFWSVY